MVALVFDQFGGEFPSVAPRDLGMTSATLAKDMLATTQELRPVRGDSVVDSAAAVNPRTLYRFQRRPDGSFNDDPTTGWISSVEEINYVKGQLNDDRTERTFFTYADGTAPPRAIDVTGQDRQLGVPAPMEKPMTNLNAGDEFTRDEADQYLTSVLAPKLVAIALGNLVDMENASRVKPDGSSVAGPYNSGMGPDGMAGPSDPLYSNVSLLLHMDGPNGGMTFLDNSPNPKRPVAMRGAQISTAKSRFGGASGLFDGANGTHLEIPSSPDFDFGTGDFTIEAFINLAGLGEGPRPGVIIARLRRKFGASFEFRVPGSRLEVFLRDGAGGGSMVISSPPGALSADVWHHVAFTRASSIVRLFVDGMVVATAQSSANPDSAEPVTVGALKEDNISSFFNGHIDELRVTKGVARYVDTFMPPDMPFPNRAAPAAGLVVATYPTSQRGLTEPWNLFAVLPSDVALEQGLNDPQLGGTLVDGQIYIPITALPYWGYIMDVEALKADLRLVEGPMGEVPFFSEAQVNGLATLLVGYFNPDDDKLRPQRTSLDTTVTRFREAVNTRVGSQSAAPVRPTPPTVPEFQYLYDGTDSNNLSIVRDPLWIEYDLALAAFEAGRGQAGASSGDRAAAVASRLSAIVAAQTQAITITRAIETEFSQRKANLLQTLITGARNNNGLIKSDTNPDGLFELSPERIVDSRFYIVTFVTDWDEESQPSPVSDLIEVDQNDTVVVTIPTPAPGRFINRWRLYRSNVGNQTAAFQFVDEGPIDTLMYTDMKKNSELQEICPSFTWAEPPPNLRGLVGMPNGIMAGFFDNSVCFCEPYHPYAWPVDYQITTEFPIVGLGVFGQTLVVTTRANPYLISGSDSASMSSIKMESNHACVSRRSIVSIQGGVMYAGADGICLINQSGVQVVTAPFWLREDWQELGPETIFAAEHDGVYVFSFY